MLQAASAFKGCSTLAKDGPLGTVSDFLLNLSRDQVKSSRPGTPPARLMRSSKGGFTAATIGGAKVGSDDGRRSVPLASGNRLPGPIASAGQRRWSALALPRAEILDRLETHDAPPCTRFEELKPRHVPVC